MRIINLEFQAFGPYPNKVVINFVPINERQLFLITGPTGCGKTTIFDAISYALFSECSGTYRDVNGLRSHLCKTNERTYVKLEFEISGNRYLITRYPPQELLNQKGKAMTKSSEATLVMPSGNIIEGVRNVDEMMSRILKLNATQFKHIVMLAQGEFRRMLFADSKEREEIFRTIFGTDDFKRFQEILQEMKTEASNKKDLICRDIDTVSQAVELTEKKEHLPFSVIPLTEGNDPFLDEIAKEVSLGKEKIANAEIEIKAFNFKIDELRISKQKYDSINQQLDELEANARKLLELKNQEAEIEHDRIIMQRIEKLPLVETIENNFLDLNQEYEDSYNTLQNDLKQLTENENKLGEKNKELTDISDELATFKKQAEEQKIDFYASNLNKFVEYDDLVQRANSLAKEIVQDEAKLIELNNNRIKKTTTYNELQARQTERKDFILQKTSIYSDLSSKKRMLEILGSITDNTRDYINMVEKLEALNAQEAIESTNYQNLSVELTNLELAYSQYQAGVLASDLMPGKPCPVCGSLEHPKKAKFENESISKEKLDSLKEKREKELKKYQALLGRISEQKGILSTLKQQIFKDLENVSLDMINDLNEAFFTQMESLKVQNQSSYHSLKSLYEEIEEEEKVYNSTDEILENLTKEIETLKNSFTEQNEAKVRKESTHQELSQRIQSIQVILPDNYENAQKLKELIDKCITYQTELETSQQAIQTELTVLNTTISEQKINIEKNQKALCQKYQTVLKKKEELDKKIKEVFGDEKSYLECKEKKNRLVVLKTKIENYQASVTSVTALVESLKEKTKNQSYTDLSVFDQEINKLMKQREAYSTLRDQLNITVTNNQKKLIELKKLYQEFIESEKYCQLLVKLDNTARGNNDFRISFERYILANYFESILNSANLKFQQMTGMRYEFVKKEKVKGRAQQGLEINIFDNYSGRERDVKSLSGGELFKASLALALGLSDIIQRNVGSITLNTLFIDEGFGSLDAESLDIALQTISDIQSSGKIIGIISHVQEVKDRFSTKIIIGTTKEGSYISNIIL